MARTLIAITHDKEIAADLKHKFLMPVGQSRFQAPKLINMLEALSLGVMIGSAVVQVDDGNLVAASGTLTCANAGVAGDTFTINGVVFTAVASGATGNQYNVGGSAAATAANIASAIVASASAIVSGIVQASATAAVVTVSALVPGQAGNAVTITGGQASVVASGARLTGGLDSTNALAYTHRYGV